ncbi:MAG: hypothetical protein Q8O31_00540 [Rhodocyclaceae bacterium]|nr:hypothetical protein [Rhodocyclaceae bacterium]
MSAIKKWLLGGVTEAAKKLAQEMSKGYPASMEDLPGKKPAELRHRALVQLLTEGVLFQQAQQMGLLRKIFFARAFQKEMGQLGYSPTLTRQILSELLAKISFAHRL